MPSPGALLARVRERRPAIDHLIRAYSRYAADTGDRLAAAVTFFGFLSFFPLLALAASVLAYAIGDDAIDTVVEQVNAYAPGLAEQLGLRDILGENSVAGVVGLVSLLGLLYSGTGWIDALRQALRTIWHQNVRVGNLIRTKLADVVVLAGLGATMLVSIALSAAAGAFTGVALEMLGLEQSRAATLTVTAVGTVLSLLTSTLLFLYLFLRLPRVQTPWRRVVRGAVLAAVLFEVLKRVGAIYIDRTTENPLYGAFAVVVGLLVWINLVSRMLLFCAAWTVTAPYDSDVEPSGTASAAQARLAGIPVQFADTAEPPAVLHDGAPSPLTAALQGQPAGQDAAVVDGERAPVAPRAVRADARAARDAPRPRARGGAAPGRGALWAAGLAGASLTGALVLAGRALGAARRG